jgi:hypothetical protein
LQLVIDRAYRGNIARSVERRRRRGSAEQQPDTQ